ncbi:hypothetical protein ACWDF6_19850, partial [Streptomyces sp. NPDC001155]
MALPSTPHSPGRLVVIQALKPKRCATCRRGPLSLLVLEDGAPRCLHCADLGHLVFLPRGDTALTRRSREESGLSVVVVRFNRRKSRYERQGVLVEEAALARAEARCLADAEACAHSSYEPPRSIASGTCCTWAAGRAGGRYWK